MQFNYLRGISQGYVLKKCKFIPYWMGGANIATKDEEKAEVLNAFFAPVFNSQTSYSQGIQPPVLEDRDGEQNKPSIIQGEAVNTTWTLSNPWGWMGSTEER